MPYDQDPTQFEGEVALYEKQDRKKPPPEDPILFYGSSSIRFWRLKKYFRDHHNFCLNRGFGGSGLKDALHYFDRLVLPHHPRALVLYTGENDLGHGAPIDFVIDHYHLFVEQLHTQLPRCQLLILPIKPSPTLWGKWAQMEVVNTAISSLAATNSRIDTIDTATPMLSTGREPRPELYMKDQLHMSPTGYELWSELIEPWLDLQEPSTHLV